jgi:hypothetical protein
MDGHVFKGQHSEEIYQQIVAPKLEYVKSLSSASYSANPWTLRASTWPHRASVFDYHYNRLVEYYKKETMSRELDEHKIASCLCGSLCFSKMLKPHPDAYTCSPYYSYPNEMLAYLSGLEIIRMKLAFCYKSCSRMDVVQYIRDNLQYYQPNNISDNHLYLANFMYNLSQGFDHRSYAMIYFHLETEMNAYIRRVFPNAPDIYARSIPDEVAP